MQKTDFDHTTKCTCTKQILSSKMRHIKFSGTLRLKQITQSWLEYHTYYWLTRKELGIEWILCSFLELGEMDLSNKNNIFTLLYYWEQLTFSMSTWLVFRLPGCPLRQMSSLHKTGSFAHTFQALYKWWHDKQDSVWLWNSISHYYIDYILPFQ